MYLGAWQPRATHVGSFFFPRRWMGSAGRLYLPQQERCLLRCSAHSSDKQALAIGIRLSLGSQLIGTSGGLHSTSCPQLGQLCVRTQGFIQLQTENLGNPFHECSYKSTSSEARASSGPSCCLHRGLLEELIVRGQAIS